MWKEEKKKNAKLVATTSAPALALRSHQLINIARQSFFHNLSQSLYIINIVFAKGGAHLPIAHALRLQYTHELRFG